MKFLIERDAFQKIKVYEQRTSFLNEIMQYDDSINSCLESLQLFGVEVPRKVTDDMVDEGIVYRCYSNVSRD